MRSFAEIVVPEALEGLGLAGAALDDAGDVAFELSGFQVLLSHRAALMDALWVTVGVGPAPQADHGGDADALRWMLDAAGEQWLDLGTGRSGQAYLLPIRNSDRAGDGRVAGRGDNRGCHCGGRSSRYTGVQTFQRPYPCRRTHADSGRWVRLTFRRGAHADPAAVLGRVKHGRNRQNRVFDR